MEFKSKFIFTLIISLFLYSSTSNSQNLLTVELYTGVPLNIPLPLKIHQAGYDDINIIAVYNSEPFKVPIYWNWRISYWLSDRGVEIEATHHKLFLKNKPREVEEFAISHGLNAITVNYAWKTFELIFRTGVGIVWAHPENVIRARKLNENGGNFGIGYYITGPAINFAAGKRFLISNRLFIQLDGKLNISHAVVPIVYGYAEVYNVALQFNIGLGFNLIDF